MTVKPKITNAELRALTGASRSQVAGWEADGLPYVERRGKGGRPAHLYDRRGALEWVAAHGRGRAGVEAGSILRRESSGGSPEVADDIKRENDDRPVLAGLTDIYQTSLQRSREWAEAEAGAMAAGRYADAAVAARARGEAAKIAAATANAVTEQAKEMGVLVVASEMEGTYIKVLATVRNNILAVPDAITPLLLPFMRNPDDAPKVRQLLEDRIADALRAIADADEE